MSLYLLRMMIHHGYVYIEVTLIPSSDWHKDNPGEKSLIGTHTHTRKKKECHGS